MMRLSSFRPLFLATTALFAGCVAESTSEVGLDAADGGADLEDKIYQGTVVGTCGWPTTVYTGGCTGALIHERVISTAQHCGTPTRVTFGESSNGRTVRVKQCVGSGSPDSQLCELAEAVTDVPVTPLLFGCELGRYLRRGQNITVVGFGRDDSRGGRSGIKEWTDQVITSVGNTSFIVGPPSGQTSSLCNGDSGGPAYVRVGDGSWRVLGTTWSNAAGPNCRQTSRYARPDAVVRNFEQRTGIDITPCFDSSSGAWNPGRDCGGFFAGDHRGSGTWSNWCSGTRTAGYSAECGAAFGGGGNGGGSSGNGGGTGNGGGNGCHTVPPNDSSYCTSSCPCNEGEGDCDSNSQCAGSLVCQEQGSVDRCVKPSTGGGSCRDSNANCSAWARNGECTKNPGYMLTNCCASCNAGGGNGGSCHTVPANDSSYCTSACACSEGEGDCDNDSQCASGLVCQESGAVDRCVRRAEEDDCSRTPAVFRDNGGTGYGLCQGDCDRDSDCARGLVCAQRNTGDAVRGCAGVSTNNTDYCVSPVCL